MVLDTRQGMVENMAVPPTSTVADKVASQVGGGIPSVAQPQDNQDPRLMAGVGGMNTNPVTERNSMDTPMTGVAQLPAQQMMAGGGIVGFQDRGLVEDETKYFGKDGVIFDTTNPLDYLMAVPGLGVGYGLARLGYKGLRAAPAAYKGYKKSLGRRKRGDSVTDLKLRRDPKTGRIRSDEVIGGAVLGSRARRGVTGLATLGSLGYFGSGLLPEGSDEPTAEKPNLPDMPDIPSKFDKERFMKTLWRQGMLTGRNIATDATGQGIVGSALGGYGKAVGDLAASDIAQEDKLAQLGLTAFGKGRVTPANRLTAIKIIDERRMNGDYDREAEAAVEMAPAKVQAELNKYKIVASGKKQLLAEYAKLLYKLDEAATIRQISGYASAPSTAGYSVAPSTAG